MRTKAAFATEFLLRELLQALGVVAAAAGGADSLTESMSMSEDSASQAVAAGAGGNQPRVMMVRRTSRAHQSVTLVDRQFDVEAFVPSGVLATLERTHGYKTLGRLKGSVVRVDKYHFATYARCVASDTRAAAASEKTSVSVPTVGGGAKARVYLWVDALSVVDDNELAVNSVPDVYSHPTVAARLQALDDAELEKQLMIHQGLPSLPQSASPSALEHFGDERPLLDADCVIPDDQEQALDAQDGWGAQDFATQQPTDSELIEENGVVPMPESQSQRMALSPTQSDGSMQPNESLQSKYGKQASPTSTQDHTVDVDTESGLDSQSYPFQQEDIHKTFVVCSGSDTDSDSNAEDGDLAEQSVANAASSPAATSSQGRAVPNGSSSPAATTSASQKSNPQEPDARVDSASRDVPVGSRAAAELASQQAREVENVLEILGTEKVVRMTQEASPPRAKAPSQTESVMLSGSETQLPVGDASSGRSGVVGRLLKWATRLGIMDASSEEQEQSGSQLPDQDSDDDGLGVDFPSQATVTFDDLEGHNEEPITQTLSQSQESQQPLTQAPSPTRESQPQPLTQALSPNRVSRQPLTQAMSSVQTSDRCQDAQSQSASQRGSPLQSPSPQGDGRLHQRGDDDLYGKRWDIDSVDLADDTHSFEYEGEWNNEDEMDEVEPAQEGSRSPSKRLPERQSSSSDAEQPEFAPTPEKQSTVAGGTKSSSESAAAGFQTPSPSALSMLNMTPGTAKKSLTPPQAAPATPAHAASTNGRSSEIEVDDQEPQQQRTPQESSPTQLRAYKRNRRTSLRESTSPLEVTLQARTEGPAVGARQSIQGSANGHGRASKKQRRGTSPKAARHRDPQPVVDLPLRLGGLPTREGRTVTSSYSLQTICQSLGPQSPEQVPIERKSRSLRRPQRVWKKYEHLFPPLDLERLKRTIAKQN